MREFLKVGLIAFVAAFLGALLAVTVVGGISQSPAGVGGYTEGDWDSAGGYKVDGTQVISGTGVLTGSIANTSFNVGASGSTFDSMKAGVCYPFVPSNTIAASSSQSVECSAANGSLSANAGVFTGDTVFLTATSSISTAGNGVVIEAVQASTTANGGITFVLRNNTGASFSWATNATPTLRYFDISQ